MEVKNNLKVCIIVSYFGKLPHYYSLWLKSCKWNPTIDFMVCSDVQVDCLPENVIWKLMTFESFRVLVEKKLEMKVQLSTPYECCDFKAVYGSIFEDDLHGYDYWGYCDMDMLFGDLAFFFRKYQLAFYDKFEALGHLTLMRNTEENNQRYKLPCTPGKGYKDAFITNGSTHFDEDEINDIYYAYGFPFFDERIHADIAPEFRRMTLSFRASHFQNYKYQTFYWQNGKVWRAYLHDSGTWRGVENEEFAYIHFQKRKMMPVQFSVEKVDRFYICPDHFEEKREIQPPSLGMIKKTNPYSWFGDKRDWIKIQTTRIIKRLQKNKT